MSILMRWLMIGWVMHLFTCLYMYQHVGNLGPFATYLRMFTVHMSTISFIWPSPKESYLFRICSSHSMSHIEGFWLVLLPGDSTELNVTFPCKQKPFQAADDFLTTNPATRKHCERNRQRKVWRSNAERQTSLLMGCWECHGTVALLMMMMMMMMMLVVVEVEVEVVKMVLMMTCWDWTTKHKNLLSRDTLMLWFVQALSSNWALQYVFFTVFCY